MVKSLAGPIARPDLTDADLIPIVRLPSPSKTPPPSPEFVVPEEEMDKLDIPRDPAFLVPVVDIFTGDDTLTTTFNPNVRFLDESNSTAFTNFSNNFNSTLVNNQRSGNVLSNLCGVPGICHPSAEQNCFDVTLTNCSDCSDAASGFFVFIVLCLGLAILFGNSLILGVSAHLWKKRTITHIDWYKASLAVADLMTGFQIFFVTFPNLAWTLNSSFEQIQAQRPMSQNAGQAIAGGFFYFLVYTSSLYHLLLLGVTRLYAINWPHQYRQMSMKSVYFGIAVVWALAAVAASFPAWFPQYFNFDYYHVTFLYLPSLIISPSSSFTPGIIVLVVFLIIPYALMTLLLLFTAISVRRQVISSKKRLGKSSGKSSEDLLTKEEVAAFKTVSLMQLGFTITLVPLCVAAGLIYSGLLTCDSFSTPYMICLYLTMTNSLVNVLVYSVREKKFRSTARDVFQNFKSTFFNAAVLSSGTKFTSAHSKNKTASVAHSSTV